MRSKVLKEESEELIKEYVDEKILTYEQAYKLAFADKYSDIEKIFTDIISLTDATAMKVWWYIIHHVWEGGRSKEEMSTVFGMTENIMFKELLKNGGIMRRKHCIERFKTKHLSDVAAENLISMGLVDKIEMKNNYVVYILNLKFYREATNNGR